MGTLNMNFSYEDVFGVEMPESYQRLLLDCMVGDQTLFARFDGVQVAWELLNPVLETWQNEQAPLAEYPAGRASYSHPLGLMFAIAGYFNASGVHIEITSSSPPRSALGGSSAAAVAITAAFSAILLKENKIISRQHIAMLAHTIEETVAGVPCGMQDQLAAAYGGVNEWYWPGKIDGPPFIILF